MEFAMKAIEKEELGKDDITDFLTVSFSTDYVGHLLGTAIYGITGYVFTVKPLLTLNYLDKTVGKDNYLLF
jgi:hypothetical protein